MESVPGFEDLKRFFDKPACQRATAPLKTGVEIGVRIESDPPLTLRRVDKRMEVLAEAPVRPDMTFQIPLQALKELADNPSDDVGEIGIQLLQLMAHPEPARRMQAKVHIGPMELFLRGYFSVLPLGGTSVMKYLASKGFTGVSKIKDGIRKMRS